MRAVLAHDAAEGLRTWELVEAYRYWVNPVAGPMVNAMWRSGDRLEAHIFPLDFVQVVA